MLLRLRNKSVVITVLLLLGVCTFGLFAEEKTKSSKPGKNNITDSYDFGDVKEGKSPSHKFKYTNNGENPITILESRVPCGCAAIDITKQTIKPGASFEFFIKLKTGKHTGKITKKFYLLTNSKKVPIITYQLKANILIDPAPKCSLPAYLDLNQASPKTIKKMQCTIKNPGNRELVLNYRKISKTVKLITLFPLKIAPGQSKTFEFTVTTPEKLGKFYDKIAFTTNIKRRPTIFLLIKGKVK